MIVFEVVEWVGIVRSREENVFFIYVRGVDFRIVNKISRKNGLKRCGGSCGLLGIEVVGGRV